jgi:hypothetical protein
LKKILLSICVLAAFAGKAQNVTFNQLLVSTVDFKKDTLQNNVVNTSEVKKVYFELSDTSQLANVRVKLGTTQNGSDVLNQTFGFADAPNLSFNPAALPDGTIINWNAALPQPAFFRTGINCSITLGNFVNVSSSYITLEALSNSGTILGTYSGIAY